MKRPSLTTIWRALVLLSLITIAENTRIISSHTMRIQEYTERTWRALPLPR